VQQTLAGDHLHRQANYTDFVPWFCNFVTKTVNTEQRAQTQTTHTNYEPTSISLRLSTVCCHWWRSYETPSVSPDVPMFAT